MPLADVFSLLVLGQGKSGLDVARWALAHPERVSAVTVYGGGTSELNDATRALEAAGAVSYTHLDVYKRQVPAIR